MTGPICLSPLRFYDDTAKQNHHKSYAYNHISPLIVKLNSIPPFQFVIEEETQLSEAYLRNAKDERVTSNIAQTLIEESFKVMQVEDYRVVMFKGLFPISEMLYEGDYYLELIFSNAATYYSEIFCFTNSVDDCLKIEYKNKGNDFYVKDGIITFQDNFKFELYLKSELGKPNYEFEEEATKRLGYSFIESQVSKKVYRFNAVVPEYLCDAMRLIRLCSDKKLISKGETYDMITFNMDVDWQEQGDLASVTCEFETDNIITNLGGFVPIPAGGDYNNDYNKDFDNQ